MKLKPIILSTILILGACSSMRQAGSRISNSKIITEYEIIDALQKRPLTNAYELISFLRPTYLTPRPKTTISQGVIMVSPMIYLNNMLYGTLYELYNIGAGEIGKVEYLSGPQATIRFGTGHAGGAILITTR